MFDRTQLRLDARLQVLATLVRHRLSRGVIETLEAESLALELLRRALSGCNSRAAAGSIGRRKLVDRAKLVLASDLGRRWTLAAVAADVGVSPVYLTQVFQQVEGLPLYRYQLQLRLARALDLLGDNAGLTDLALDLGFSSHSHFSAAFKRAYGQTPSAFQRSARMLSFSRNVGKSLKILTAPIAIFRFSPPRPRQTSNARFPPMTRIILHHYDTSPYAEKFGPGLASRALPGPRSSFPSSCRNRIDGADGRVSQDAGSADRRGHLLR